MLLAGAGNPPCPAATAGTPVIRTGRAAAGMFAAPLQLRAGRWYRVGATEYSGGVAASGAYLPSTPDSFAELSLLDHNPYPRFTFTDANALDNLPYGTSIRVANGPREQVLVKRDIGYGQGPGQTLPYRIDVYGAAAAALAISKNPVDIELAPSSGTPPPSGNSPKPPPPRALAGAPRAERTAAAHPRPDRADPAQRSAAAPQDAPRRGQTGDRRRQPDPQRPYSLTRRSGRPLRAAGEPVARL